MVPRTINGANVIADFATGRTYGIERDREFVLLLADFYDAPYAVGFWLRGTPFVMEAVRFASLEQAEQLFGAYFKRFKLHPEVIDLKMRSAIRDILDPAGIDPDNWYVRGDMISSYSYRDLRRIIALLAQRGLSPHPDIRDYWIPGSGGKGPERVFYTTIARWHW